MHRAARKTKGGGRGGGWQKKEKKRSRENSVTQRREKNQRRRRLRRSSSSGVNKIPPPKPPFLFGPPSLLPLEKYIESLLSFLSEEESEHRPKSLMRLEATRGELGRRSPLPVPLWGSLLLLLLFPHRNRLRNWRSRREGKSAQLVWFPKKI